MIVFGVSLLIIGFLVIIAFFARIAILWTVGAIVGLVLMLLGASGPSLAGRRLYY
jgi:Family of unknown function (DUF6131)